MKKILTSLIILLSFLNITYAEEIPIDITAESAILYNLNDNQIIYEKNSNTKNQVASLTKLMTAIVAIENIEDLDAKVTIKNNVFYGLEGYSQAGFKIGWQLSYRELLYGLMLPSGADAVNAIVLNMGTKAQFIDLMNEKATELKLTNTHFDNAIGMDSKDNYSTAEDMGKLLLYALKNEEFKKIFSAREYKIERYNLTLKSTLLKYSTSSMDVSNIKGAKSGFTDGAGLCLASIATINDINYLLINLGSNPNQNKSQAVKDTLTVYNYYGDNYDYTNIIEENQVLKTIKNKFGHEEEYDIYATDNVSMYLKNTITTEDLTYTYDGIEEINYKNKKGDKLGTVTISYNEQILDTYEVYLNDELEYYHPVLYTIIIISIILILLIVRLLQMKHKKNRRRKRRKKRK